MHGEAVEKRLECAPAMCVVVVAGDQDDGDGAPLEVEKCVVDHCLRVR